MQEERKKYIVMWKMMRLFKRRGLWNRITGRRVAKMLPMMHVYNSEEIAKYGYSNIKNNGGIRPYLLKVIEE